MMADESMQSDPDAQADSTLQPDTEIPVQIDSLEADGTRPGVGDMVTLKVDGTVKRIENDCVYVTPETINDTDLNDLLAQSGSQDEDAAMERMTREADMAGGGGGYG